MKTVPKNRGGLLASMLIGLAAMTSAPSAHAVIGALDRVPAATLLLPYFEVDAADPNGAQTRFTVVNSSATQQMAHVTLWTDMGVPTFAFDMFIGGRGSVEVDLRLLFSLGILPQTAASNTSPGLPPGPDSNAYTSVASCSADAMYAGFPVPNQLPTNLVSDLLAAHEGHASGLFGNMCAAANHNDNVARGYITIDAANGCSSEFPTDPGYFVNGGTGVASDNNVLFGTYTTIERGNNVTAASPLVALEASSTAATTSIPGAYTFYGNYVGGTAADNRESLGGSVWQARTLNVAFFDPGTDLVVWEDPGFPHHAFTCGSTRPDFPRKQAGITAFDEQEHVFVLNMVNSYPNPPPPPVYPFPLIAQRVPAAMMSPFPSGSIFINLNQNIVGASIPGVLQSYVGVRQRLNGVFGAELPAAQNLDFAGSPSGPGF